jgi:phage terminase large subunit-like protein
MAARARKLRAEETPFTLEHFQAWVGVHKLTLDSGELLELEPFQLEIVADILSGVRRVWAILPEGTAKTTLMALVALYQADHTPSPWIPIGAASRDQAEIMFGQAGGFVERSPSLRKRFRVYEGYRKIKSLANGGRGIKVYAADAGTGDGVIPSPCAYVDELHRHKDLKLYRLWRGKLNKRDAQIVVISTAGEPESDFEQTRAQIRDLAVERVYDGCHLRATGESIVYHEWAVPRPEDAKNLEIVKAANPLKQVTIEYLAEKLRQEDLDYGEDWLRLTCNIPTRSSFAAIPEKDWDACCSEERIPEGVPVAVGADFAWIEDTTSIIPLYIQDPEVRIFGDPFILEPPGDGTMLDADDVKNAFRELHERNPIDLIVADPSKAQDVIQWAEKEFNCTVIPRQQTNAFAAEDYEMFMEALRERWIHHSGHLGFRRHALSAIRSRLAGDKHRFDRPRTLRKQKKDERRIVIDALTAAAMVHSAVAVSGSVYDERDLVLA